MTFGLKNAGATYQKAIQKCLASQIEKNIEVYVDDCDRTAQNSFVLSPKPVHVAIKQ
jgi:hypothetical protein